MRKNNVITKNKLLLLIAVLSTVIIALPVSYAQSNTGSSLFFVLINAAIVGVILFALQSFLIPQKNPKEQTAVWVAIIAGSLLIAWIYGNDRIIWQGPLAIFFNRYVIVNALLIGTILYFVMQLIPAFNKLYSPEGKTGTTILLFLISIFLALNISPNRWLWELQNVRNAMGFLFANGTGILNPKGGLLVFVSSFVLISFFFNGYLLEKGDKKLNYALALIFAVNLAMPPVNPIRDVIQLGEIFFVLILWNSLKGTVGGDNQIIAFLLAVFLVAWASAALTINAPEHRGIMGNMVCHTPLINCKTGTGTSLTGGGWKSSTIMWTAVIGVFLLFTVGGGIGKKLAGGSTWIILAIIIGLAFLFFGFGLIGKILLILLAPFILIGLIVFGVVKGEKRAKWWDEGLTRLRKEIDNIISRNEFLNRLLGKVAGLRDKTLENELPSKLKELRFHIYTLMNYMLRHDVWYSKSESFKLTVKKIEEEEGRLQELDPIPMFPGNSIKKQIEGNEIKKDESQKPIWTQDEIGMGRPYLVVYRLIELFKSRLEGDLTVYNENREQEEKRSAIESFKEQTQGFQVNIQEVKDRYKSGFERFGRTNVLRSYRRYFLDMYNMYGKYERGYHFAKEDAIPDFYDYEIEKDDGIIKKIKIKDKVYPKDLPTLTLDERRSLMHVQFKNKRHLKTEELELIEKVERYRNFYKNNKFNFEKDGIHLLETTLFGKCLTDRNSIAIDGFPKDKVPYIRFYPPGEMWELYRPVKKGDPIRFNVMFGWASKDWDFAQDDMGKGTYHFFSKKISDYNFIDEEGLLDYSKATFKGPKPLAETAFDLEGLKTLHQFNYWGRRNYYDEQGMNLQTPVGIVNPYPTITLLGLWMFIRSVVKRKVLEPEAQKKFLQEFQMQYEQLDKIEKGGKQSD